MKIRRSNRWHRQGLTTALQVSYVSLTPTIRLKIASVKQADVKYARYAVTPPLQTFYGIFIGKVYQETR